MEKRQKPRPHLVTPRSCEISSVGFAHAARQLSESARSLGLEPPAFRSPPRTSGLSRSIVRRADGSATVAVALRGRPAAAVMADMIDGIVAANHVAGSAAPRLRDELWAAGERALAQALADGERRDANTGRRSGHSSSRSRRPVLQAVSPAPDSQANGRAA